VNDLRLVAIQGTAAQKFEPGQVVITATALHRLSEIFPEEHDARLSLSLLLALHVSGNWGNLDDEDKRANENALKSGARILSKYDVGADLYFITDAVYDRDTPRQLTTIMLPSDY